MGLFKTDEEKIEILKRKRAVQEAKFEKEKRIAEQRLEIEKIKAKRVAVSKAAGPRRDFTRVKESGNQFLGLLAQGAKNFNNNLEADLSSKRSSKMRKRKGRRNDDMMGGLNFDL